MGSVFLLPASPLCQFKVSTFGFIPIPFCPTSQNSDSEIPFRAYKFGSSSFLACSLFPTSSHPWPLLVSHFSVQIPMSLWSLPCSAIVSALWLFCPLFYDLRWTGLPELENLLSFLVDSISFILTDVRPSFSWKVLSPVYCFRAPAWLSRLLQMLLTYPRKWKRSVINCFHQFLVVTPQLFFFCVCLFLKLLLTHLSLRLTPWEYVIL